MLSNDIENSVIMGFEMEIDHHTTISNISSLLNSIIEDVPKNSILDFGIAVIKQNNFIGIKINIDQEKLKSVGITKDNFNLKLKEIGKRNNLTEFMNLDQMKKSNQEEILKRYFSATVCMEPIFIQDIDSSLEIIKSMI